MVTKHGNKWSLVYKDGAKTRRFSHESRETVEAFREALIRDRNPPEPVSIVPKSYFLDYLESFLAIRAGKRDLTKRNVRSILTNYFTKHDDITPLQVIEHCKNYRNETKKGILKWLKAFALYYNKTVDKDRNFGCDWKELHHILKSEDAKPKPYLSDDDFLAVLKVATPCQSLIIRMMASSGLRVRELTRLDVRDYNRKTKEVTLPASKAKAGTERTFFVPAELVDELDATVLASSGQPLFHYANRRISPNGLSNTFRDLCVKAGIGKRNIHLLRAYAITVILRNSNDNYELVRRICGWDSQEMRKYLGRMEDKKRLLAERTSFSSLSAYNAGEVKMLGERIVEFINGQYGNAEVASRETGLPISIITGLLNIEDCTELKALATLAGRKMHRVGIWNETVLKSKMGGRFGHAMLHTRRAT